MAVELGNIEIIKLLLRNKNIHINDPYLTLSYEKDDHEYDYSYRYYNEEETKTPLFLAIENKKIEIVKILLENKDIDINNKILTISILLFSIARNNGVFVSFS